MSEHELITINNEKDLFLFLQKDRLLTAKRLNDGNIEKTKKVKEDKKTFKGTIKNIRNFFKRSAHGYEEKDGSIEKAIKEFEEKNPNVIALADAESLIETLFKEDKYGISKLLFACSIVLDDEYDYKYEEEGLKDVSVLLYGDEVTLLTIKKQLHDNYNAISPKTLSNTQKGLLIGAVASAAIGLISMPVLLASGVAAAAIATDGFTDKSITFESILMGAAIGGMAFGEMELYNDEKVKAEFKSLSPEKNALYLALQCTYIERIKAQLSEDEFKDQLDSILKNLSALKSDLDYYLFVEKESIQDNKAKIKSFHEFDNRLPKVLGI